MREFNILGLCVPEKHYMVRLDDRVEYIRRQYIEKGYYFAINRARQYGKTTTLNALERGLSCEYTIIRISFEGLDASAFASIEQFTKAFLYLCARYMRMRQQGGALLQAITESPIPSTMLELGSLIASIVSQSNQPVVLMIDEVDKSANNQLFLDFLSMLRNKYLDRDAFENVGEAATFQSVILVGVYDVKNLKLKLRQDEKSQQNSPWNIAADFNLDMGFSAEQISGMLDEYEADHRKGFNVQNIAHELHIQTGGYPFLVSMMCKMMDETNDWSLAGLHRAVAKLINSTNTLFDDIIKNLNRHVEFYSVIEAILLHGKQITYMPVESGQSLGFMFGILAESNRRVRIANRIFEQYIFNYLIARQEMKTMLPSREIAPSLYIKDARLNVQTVLERFAALMKSENRVSYGKLIEKQWRMMFLLFLRPIINGTGHYSIEPETSDDRRMDLQVFYGIEEHIIELKIWRGGEARQQAYEQLAGYLDARGQKKGYLLIFCSMKNTPQSAGWVRYGEHMIYEEIVPYASTR